MDGVSISTERLRDLLREFQEKKFAYRACSARDIVGPGGGVYITANSEFNEKHLDWLERRNPSSESPTYVDVVFLREVPTAPEQPALEEVAGPTQVELKQRAEQSSEKVVRSAEEVALQAEAVYRSLGRSDFSVADLRRGDNEAGLREFEARLKNFRGAVKKAIGEYLQGNTLVMDLILRYHLDKRTVRHGLNVAAFATEMAAQMALRGGSGSLEHYFSGLDAEQVLGQLGEDAQGAAELSAADLAAKRRELFERELAEIFLGGFMHDCGLWNEPLALPEGHEVQGAKLIWDLEEVQRFAPSLVKIVLFHSDIARLADRCGVVKIIEAPEDAEKITFRREFFRTLEEARQAIEMRPGNFAARILSQEDVRKIMPVALAERYVSQTQDIHAKPRWEVISELARYVSDGLFLRYMVTLCNAQLEVIAPPRAYVKLAGSITVAVEDRKEGRRVQRLEVEDFEAGSICHAGDRNSPHLVTLFIRRPDGSRDKAGYVAAQDPALWDRSAGVDNRMYLPVGRFRNSLSIQVTGFISEDVYGKILGEYERELHRRME